MFVKPLERLFTNLEIGDFASQSVVVVFESDLTRPFPHVEKSLRRKALILFTYKDLG